MDGNLRQGEAWGQGAGHDGLGGRDTLPGTSASHPKLLSLADGRKESSQKEREGLSEVAWVCAAV